MPDTSPDLLLLFGAGLLLVLLATLGRATPRATAPRRQASTRAASNQNPIAPNPPPSTGRDSLPSQANLSA